MIEVPEAFVRGTEAREGPAGTAWLAELPALVGELLARWDCVPDGTVTHGAVGVIVPARRRRDRAGDGEETPRPDGEPRRRDRAEVAEETPRPDGEPRRGGAGDAGGAPRPDGEPVVVKVSFPHPGNAHEPDAFAAWRGDGAVRLHERDDERFALLLERVRTTTLADTEAAGETGGDEVVEIAGRLNNRLAVPAPPGLPRLSDSADEWRRELRADAAELPHGMPAHVIDVAVATARDLGAVQPGTLVHGDLHAGNILRATREPWLAVDPKGYVGDPAYDAGTLLKSRALALAGADDVGKAAVRVLDVFAESAGLERERVRRWAQFHAVRTAFWERRHGVRIPREGIPPEWAVAFAEGLAETLTVGT